MDYRLVILGHPVSGGLEAARTSTTVFTCLLETEWRKLSHVDVSVYSAALLDMPDTDVLLVHDYSSTVNLYAGKIKRKAQVSASFIEIPQPFDKSFIFQPHPWLEVAGRGCHLIPFPWPTELLPGMATEKEVGSVLIDHTWHWPPEAKPWGWINEVCRVLETEKESRHVAQCERFNAPPGPAWIETIPVRPFLEYLQATAAFESFIVMHKGSYNGTIIDMAVRGTRVIAKRGHCPPYQVKQLGIIEVDSGEELMASLRQSRDAALCQDVQNRVTSMAEAIRMMDEVFQEALQ